MNSELTEMIREMERLAEAVNLQKKEILGADPITFICVFCTLTDTMQLIRETQTMLTDRAEQMVNQEQMTLRKLRKQSFRVYKRADSVTMLSE